MRRVAAGSCTNRAGAALCPEWDYFRFQFAVRYPPLCEIQKCLVHYFLDSRASFVGDVSHPSHHLLIKMIYPPPANTEHFNVFRPYFPKCFHAGRCELIGVRDARKFCWRAHMYRLPILEPSSAGTPANGVRPSSVLCEIDCLLTTACEIEYTKLIVASRYRSVALEHTRRAPSP